MSDTPKRKTRIYYARVEEFWRKEEKYAYLDEKQHVGNVEWQALQSDAKGNWLGAETESDFASLIPLAHGESPSESIFAMISNGVQTNRDAWVYNFDRETLADNIRRISDTYNQQVRTWQETKKKGDKIDDFVVSDEKEIKWSSRLKERLAANVKVEFDSQEIRDALYRPFTFQNLYFDETLVHRRGRFPQIFSKDSTENLVIWLKIGSDWPMFALVTNRISDQLPQGGS